MNHPFRFFPGFLFVASVLLSSCGNSNHIDVAKASFVGNKNCVSCHAKEFTSWKTSDHAHAMDTATDKTVLGNFNNAVFMHHGFKNRLYKKDGKFYVHTLGPGGKPGDFQIAYTFGYRPLQQYLVPFDSGRLQCLQIAWDTQRKCWYDLTDSLHKGETIAPDDWLYWTNNGQNWNGMCAECHSTNLRKNYNPKTHVYHTTWSEINVSCEACHGPASEHLKWARLPENERKKYPNYALRVHDDSLTADQLIGQCAYCHARRSSFGDFIYPHKDMFNIMAPQLPVEPVYFVDGQIKEEDYVYSSFTQSRMYHEKVRCTNCHDVHSLKVKYNGDNRLCEQCHQKKVYDTFSHTHHKFPGQKGKPLVLDHGKRIIPVGEGSKCINCHMPGRYYMGVDFRRDHSMRIPRPDLSVKLGTPNACNSQCHTDKSAQWAASFAARWYGKKHPHQFGETFEKVLQGDTTASHELLHIIHDSMTTPIIRASAVMYLGQIPPSVPAQQTIRKKLKDPNPMVRNEAVKAFVPTSVQDMITTLGPLLNDSTRLVRLSAVLRLSQIPVKQMDTTLRTSFWKDVKEYVETMDYSADFAPSRHNLGVLYSNLGDLQKARENFEEALRIDNQFYPAKVNLAIVYNKLHENNKAEKLLKEVIKSHPELPETYYSLGLLEAEMGNYDASARYLKTASEKMPDRPRIFLNLAKVLQYLHRMPEAEKAFLSAYQLEPENPGYLSELIGFYLKNGKKNQAVHYLKQWVKNHPHDQEARKLLSKING
ncbi:tetratricopeptide repeat protein [Candidatus Sulfidibacterium hydrothermale]|uniref:tetratricopeptide repeat protein n=1 Tax=Candidatus Sulfidibacterium hydrothermale TaxID=2875962 RepID=UPI001F0A5A1A|nr:tetratricopeptide repeat protein [Candidatus Sulfidibacterium hydrothermale]UBM63394.1 tetratricopeptide repeat protein [Candidatus Sulfidibacterium hydrothermale]